MKLLNRFKNKIYGILRFGEQYAKTDMVYLAKGGFWLTSERVFITFFSLVLALAFGNLVPADVYGTYKYIVAAGGIVGAISLSGIGTAITQSVARGYDGVLKEAVKMFFRWSLGIVIVALAGAVYYFLQDNITLAVGFALIAIFTPILKGFEFYSGFLEGKKHFKQKSLLQIFRETVFVATLVGIMFFTDSVEVLLVGFFLIQAVSAFIAYLYTIKKFTGSESVDPSFYSFGKHLSVMRFLQALAKHADKILAFQFLGAAPLAIYSFAILPVEKTRGFDSIIRSLVLPKFSNRSIDEIRKTVFRKIAFLFAFFALGTIAYIIATPFLFDLFLPRYTEAVPYSQVFSLLLLTAPFSLLSTMLTAHQRTRELYILNTSESIGRVVLMMVFLPFYGLWGLVAALLITQYTKVGVLCLITFRRP